LLPPLLLLQRDCQRILAWLLTQILDHDGYKWQRPIAGRRVSAMLDCRAC